MPVHPPILKNSNIKCSENLRRTTRHLFFSYMRLKYMLLISLLFTTETFAMSADTTRIQPYADNPRYWQYQNQPVMLLGGTVADNCFQIPELRAHLDLLAQVGGNYVRNTMSDRPDHGYEITAFAQNADGLYDLNTWNAAYWQKFADMLRWTAERQIFVQIELWDRFDHSRENWDVDPFNPQNNVNYTHEESGLDPEYPDHPGQNKQPFFYTVPALLNNEIVLQYQRAFIDKVLSYSLAYDHVLYCMDNETNGDPAWAIYWADYVRNKAREQNMTVELTEMWDKWDVRDEEHRSTFDHPERYTFIDISQNSWQTGQTNWDRAQWVRHHIADQPRPINSTKIYGADTHGRAKQGISTEHAQQTFWRNILGGFASSRFHRPPFGLGLSEGSQPHIHSARLFANAFDLFCAEPDAESALLQNRQENEAYLTRVPGEQYAVYFPNGGAVALDLSGARGAFNMRWLNIAKSEWKAAKAVEGGGVVNLQAEEGHWLVLLEKAQ